MTWYIASATIGLSPLLDTPAHRLAIPTKIYESLRAGLPLVVSDLPLQAEFVRSEGLGAVHAVGDPDDFARAVRRVLDDLDGYRAAAGNLEMQRRFSWAATEGALTGLWHDLAPASRPVERQEGPRTSVDSTAQGLALIGLDEESALAEGWSASGSPVVHVENSAPHAGTRRARAWTRAWADVDEHADTVLYAPRALAFGGVDGELEDELVSLARRGKRCGVLLADRAVLRSDQLLRAFPTHPFASTAAEHLATYDRQLRHGLEAALRLRGYGIPMLSSSPLAAQVLDGVRFLPLAVDAAAFACGERCEDGRQIRTVAVAPGARSPSENEALDRFCMSAEAQGVTVLRPRRARDFTLDSVYTADLVIEPVHVPEYGRAAAAAMAAGAVVVGSAPLQAAAPIITTTADDLEPTLAALLSTDAESLSVRGQAGREYARTHHSGAAVADSLRTLLHERA